MPIDLDQRTPTYEPVGDGSFQSYLSYYSYDKKPLEPEITETLRTEDWTRLRITFAGPDDERILAFLYLPARATIPYQVINFVPGIDVLYDRETPDYVEWMLASHIKAGRAVMAVVQSGAVERREASQPVTFDYETVRFRDQIIHWTKEYRIGLDYLSTRGDIDMERVGYLGFSMGGSELGC